MYSLAISAVNKNGLMEIFEILTQYQNRMMIRNGDYTVDAHSLIGVLTLDVHKPIELLLETEPSESLKSALLPYTLSRVC
ncbi:MAG: HPr family phosphocarrier protein [Ruminococcus sp.]|nr:HPr family phosphocarrier protein [Ruminococcus sp.]